MDGETGAKKQDRRVKMVGTSTEMGVREKGKFSNSQSYELNSNDRKEKNSSSKGLCRETLGGKKKKKKGPTTKKWPSSRKDVVQPTSMFPKKGAEQSISFHRKQ